MASQKYNILYGRLSQEDERQGESNSITNQKKYLEDYAVQHGFGNIQHFNCIFTHLRFSPSYSWQSHCQKAWNRHLANMPVPIKKGSGHCSLPFLSLACPFFHRTIKPSCRNTTRDL